jgi:coenzyme PQQ precursor peptide PqqA
MKAVWTKPVFEESTVGAECTAYAGAQRVGLSPQESKPGPFRSATIGEFAGARPAGGGSARPGSNTAS